MAIVKMLVILVIGFMLHCGIVIRTVVALLK